MNLLENNDIDVVLIEDRISIKIHRFSVYQRRSLYYYYNAIDTYFDRVMKGVNRDIDPIYERIRITFC